MRAYAIGDIHGQLEKLMRAHDLIAADRAELGDVAAPVMHIGDLMDRGPDAKGVIDFLINGQAYGAPWLVLKGNHDRMMAWYLQEVPKRDHCMRTGFEWLDPRVGGQETLASYGVNIAAGGNAADIHRDARVKVPEAHKAFLAELPAFYQLDELYFCHAGIRPGVALQAQVEDDLCWIRQDFYASDADHGALIIHGHTPIDAVTHYGNRLNIDTGAGFDHDLSAVVIEGRKVFLLTDQGRVPVPADPVWPISTGI